MTQVNNLTAKATNIAKELDRRDGNLDNKISASIWNQYVADIGGNTVKHSISLENAIKSITAYAQRGANVELDTETKTPDAKTSESKDEIQKSREDFKKAEKEFHEYSKQHPDGDVFAQFRKLVEVAAKVKADNGMTFKEAQDAYKEIYNKYAPIKFKGAGIIMIEDWVGPKDMNSTGHFRTLSPEETAYRMGMSLKDANKLVEAANALEEIKELTGGLILYSGQS